MNRKTAFLLLALLTLPGVPILGYEQPLHKRMTRKAFLLAASQNDFTNRLRMSPDEVKKAIAAMERGAHDEDDTFSIAPVRVRNHFFNPVHQTGLTMPDYEQVLIPPCSIRFKRADKWALDPAEGNTWGKQAARDRLIEAVVGRNRGIRHTNLILAFETLGHMAHLVEDMAQPEHTRNDQHLTFSQLITGGGVAASIWEGWSAANLTHAPDSFFEGYPVVKLQRSDDYFHSSLRQGMADFSNENFFTQDTNEHDERPQIPGSFPTKCFLFNAPVANPLAAITQNVTEQYYIGPFLTSSSLAVTTYHGPVVDRYQTGTSTDFAQTVKSLLDYETRQYGVETYSLNNASYASRAMFLMPRAVGYAAGLMDRFFRGRIDAKFTLENDGTYKLRLLNLSDEAIGSDAVIIASYSLGIAGGDDMAGIIPRTRLDALHPGFAGIAPGASVIIPNLVPQDLPSGGLLLDYDRHIVVTGRLGSEDNAVIPLIQEGDKGLRITVKWTEPVGTGQVRFLFTENASGSQIQYQPPSLQGSMPDTEVTLGDHQINLRIDPYARTAGYSIKAFIVGDGCTTANWTVSWRVNGFTQTGFPLTPIPSCSGGVSGMTIFP